MSDHMTNQLRNWNQARAVLSPDLDGHNRALDRVAAEHLREVAPHLGPSVETTTVALPCGHPRACRYVTGAGYVRCHRCDTAAHAKYDTRLPCPGCGVPLPSGAHHVCYAPPAPPQPEPAKANAPRKGSKAWAIQEACRIVGIAFHGISGYDEASDCFCSESRDQDYRNGGHALAFVEAAVREKLAREKSPAPEATGEHKAKRLAARLRMNAPPTNYGDLLREAADYLETIPETERQMRAWRKMAENPREPVECKPEATGEMAAPAVVASVYCTFRDMLGEIDSKTTWMRASLTELEEEYVKARAAKETK